MRRSRQTGLRPGAGRRSRTHFLIDRGTLGLHPGAGYWRGRRVLITSGPTREYLDPIRFLTNASSGKMGFALAKAALSLGAKVVVISGPVQAEAPRGASVVPVLTAEEMRRETLARYARSDVFIAAAAVGDWRFKRRSPRKIKRSDKPLTLTLLPNPDILAEIGRFRRKPLLVGFALETHAWLASARRKLLDKGLDFIVANRAETLGSSRTRAILIGKDGKVFRLPALSKEHAAREILFHVGAGLG